MGFPRFLVFHQNIYAVHRVIVIVINLVSSFIFIIAFASVEKYVCYNCNATRLSSQYTSDKRVSYPIRPQFRADIIVGNRPHQLASNNRSRIAPQLYEGWVIKTNASFIWLLIWMCKHWIAIFTSFIRICAFLCNKQFALQKYFNVQKFCRNDWCEWVMNSKLVRLWCFLFGKFRILLLRWRCVILSFQETVHKRVWHNTQQLHLLPRS